MWVARDEDGSLYLYSTKPLRNERGYWEAPIDALYEVFRDMFPKLK